MDAGSEVDAELRQIAALARAARLRGDHNYVQRRGAILHGDVAMLAPASMAAPGDVHRRPSDGPERLRMEISDGQEIDLHQAAVHWEIARMRRREAHRCGGLRRIGRVPAQARLFARDDDADHP